MKAREDDAAMAAVGVGDHLAHGRLERVAGGRPDDAPRAVISASASATIVFSTVQASEPPRPDSSNVPTVRRSGPASPRAIAP